MAAYLSARQAAKVCGVSEKTVRRWIAAGRLKADKRGRDFRIPVSELEALCGQHAAPNGGPAAPAAAPSNGASTPDAAHWAALVRDLQAQLLERTEAATLWQARAHMLEDRIRALEAPRNAVASNLGTQAPEPTTETPEPPRRPEPSTPAPVPPDEDGRHPWWQRWWLRWVIAL
jgi:excisionase family DNA binding protein